MKNGGFVETTLFFEGCEANRGKMACWHQVCD